MASIVEIRHYIKRAGGGGEREGKTAVPGIAWNGKSMGRNKSERMAAVGSLRLNINFRGTGTDGMGWAERRPYPFWFRATREGNKNLLVCHLQ